jgi:hypothetical protein
MRYGSERADADHTMANLVRRATTAIQAFGSHDLERRHWLVPERAQLAGVQRSRVDAGRLAVSLGLDAGKYRVTRISSVIRRDPMDQG